jgi:hypothetical protein
MIKHTIKTHYIMTSLPIREFDWTAVLDGYDGSEESDDCCGTGATELEAIKDLLERLDSIEDKNIK